MGNPIAQRARKRFGKKDFSSFLTIFKKFIRRGKKETPFSNTL
jgi:hypothetical protein